MNPITHPTIVEATDWPVLPSDTPIIYEDDEDEANDMGEASGHRKTNVILETCVTEHMRRHWPKLRVYVNLNCYYAPGPISERGSLPYLSADVMMVEPFDPLVEDLTSYTIGRHGPPPLGAIEVLSKGNAQTNDKKIKVDLYSKLKIGEYILVDPTGELLDEKLLLKQLQPDGTWKDTQDEDGGVTSKFGFRLIIDEDDEVAVLDAASGKRYLRPDEALVEAQRVEAESLARRAAEKQARSQAKRADAEAKRAEAETSRAEMESKRAEAEASRAETEAKRAEAEASRAETEAKRAEAEAKRAQAEAEARRLAEEQLQAVRAELERLRQAKEK